MRLKITGLMMFGCLLSMSAGATQPWYNTELVATGSQLFQQHCAECHGANADGTSEWKKTDASGHYPPPPLNGSAHAWHHSIPQLTRSIKQGGQQLGGVMPGFGDKLDDQQILAVIAFLQSTWPTEIYDRWHNQHMQ